MALYAKCFGSTLRMFSRSCYRPKIEPDIRVYVQLCLEVSGATIGLTTDECILDEQR